MVTQPAEPVAGPVAEPVAPPLAAPGRSAAISGTVVAAEMLRNVHIDSRHGGSPAPLAGALGVPAERPAFEIGVDYRGALRKMMMRAHLRAMDLAAGKHRPAPKSRAATQEYIDQVNQFFEEYANRRR